MKYYRDWWVVTTFWWAMFALTVVGTVKVNWSHSLGGDYLFGFIIIGGYIALTFGGAILILERIDGGLNKLPKAEEKEIAKQHEEISRQFNLLEKEENLLSRRQELTARRERYMQKLERESGLR